MVDQATQVTEKTKSTDARDRNAETGAAALARDVSTLVHLQLEMVVAEFRETVRGLTLATVLLAGGAALLLGCMPVLLLALSSLLEQAGLLASAARLLAALVGVVIGGGVFWSGWMAARKSWTGLNRSREELAENIASLRAVLARQHDSAGL